MQHIPRSQMDLVQRLHDIADEIWEERNWIPRDRPLWVRLNDMAGALHQLAAAYRARNGLLLAGYTFDQERLAPGSIRVISAQMARKIENPTVA
jgi:hypothetical protein